MHISACKPKQPSSQHPFFPLPRAGSELLNPIFQFLDRVYQSLYLLCPSIHSVFLPTKSFYSIKGSVVLEQSQLVQSLPIQLTFEGSLILARTQLKKSGIGAIYYLECSVILVKIVEDISFALLPAFYPAVNPRVYFYTPLSSLFYWGCISLSLLDLIHVLSIFFRQQYFHNNRN